jgi:hypothetical protein
MARIIDMIAVATKLVLIPDHRPVTTGPRLRRYRLARLAVNPKRGSGDEQFAHLKRCYD